MKSKDFKYFVLNTLESWLSGQARSVCFDPEGSISLCSMEPLQTGIEGLRPTGVTVDECGNIFFLDANSCRIFQTSPAGETIMIPCFGGCGSSEGHFLLNGLKPEDPIGGYLAMSSASLYISDTYNHRIQGYYRHNMQPRMTLGARDDCLHPHAGSGPLQFNQPREILLDRKGDLLVLDYGNRRLQKISRKGYFLFEIGPQRFYEPQHIALDSEDNIYVLDALSPAIHKFDPCGEYLEKISQIDRGKCPFRPGGLAVDDAGLIYVGDAGDPGNVVIHIFAPDGSFRGTFESPLGSCRQLLKDPQGNLLAVCGESGQIVRLTGGHRFLGRGVYYSKAFDSTDNNTQWHRLALDADLPDKTHLTVSYFVSQDPLDVEDIDRFDYWQPLLETPFKGQAARDGLFLDAIGRYLQLRIDFLGSEVATPKIRGLEVHFPRQSYLRYLPATYREDAVGRDFMERYLSIFETVSLGVEEEIDDIPRFLDPQATNPDFVKWLECWLAVSADDNWDIGLRRRFLANAFDFYRRRGTMAGLQELVTFFSGFDPLIDEHSQTLRPAVIGNCLMVGMTMTVGRKPLKQLILEESSTIGNFALTEAPAPVNQAFAADAYDFTIRVNTTGLNADQVESLKRMIEAEKPAHTRAIILTTPEGGASLGRQSSLGIDTTVSGGFPFMRLGENSHLGSETFVATAHPIRGAIGRRSKLSIDTILV